LTACLSRRGSTFRHVMRLGVACVCLALVSAQAVAARVAVVLSDDSAPYQEVYQVIRALALNEANLAVAVGVRAAESLAALPARPPVLAVLVPRAWYVKTGNARQADGGRRSMSAIYLDQPFERQVRLIRLALPDVRRVGVLLSAEQSALAGELNEALQAQRLSLVYRTLTTEERLITPLEQVLSEAELLLAVPDPLIFNRNTAQSLFLTSYRYRVPVLGYSRSLTRAGALLSLHSSPAQIGRQAAEWVNGAIQGTSVRLPQPAHPAYFSVSINEQVARSLGFTLPSEAELEKRLGGGR
jgi:putative ABC transport system substrate-binding protein